MEQLTEGRFRGLMGAPDAKRGEEKAVDKLSSSLTETVKGNEGRDDKSADTEEKEPEKVVPGIETACSGGTDEV